MELKLEADLNEIGSRQGNTRDCHYIISYTTARFFPRFTLDGLAVYIVHIHGLFIYLHGSNVEPHPIDAFDWP